MPVRLNRTAYSNARALIEAGDYDDTSDWSLSPDEENRLLGDPPDWTEFGKWYLAIDDGASEETKARYKYPFGKNGKVYRAAIAAIRSRSSQQGVTDVFDAAGKLMELMDSQAEGSARSWYEIKAQADDTTEIYVYGDIGESWSEESVTAARLVRELGGIKSKTLDLRINSFGGSVSDGLAIYNALKRHPAQVNVSIDGIAASIASLIAMAGDTVAIAENGLLMVHAPWGGAFGNSKVMRDMADTLDKWAEAMASSYVAKTGLNRDHVMGWLSDGEDHWFTASEAIAEGLADTSGPALQIAAQLREAVNARFPRAGAGLASPVAGPVSSKPKGDTKMAAKNPKHTPSDPPEPIDPPEPNESDDNSIQAAVKSALAESHKRQVEIRAACVPFKGYPGIAALEQQLLDDPNMNPDKAREQILAAIAKNSGPVMGPHGYRVESGMDEKEKFLEAGVIAIRARAGLEKVDGQNPMRGLRLLDFARACLDRAGYDYKGQDIRSVVAAAFTQGTSDFPILLENTMYKTLLAAYATAPDTWSKFCKIGSVSDFRANNRYRAGSFGNLDSVTDLGEFKNKSIPDGEKGTVTAGTKGNIINISRQAIINDDLGAFVGLSQALGRAARRTIEADVYALLAANPNLNDGIALFYNTHGNLAGTGTAVTMAAIEAGRQAMASQKDVGGNDYLDLRPAFWVGSMGYGGDARTVNESIYDPDTANKLQKPNMVRGVFREVIDTPRISGHEWYMFADPNEAPVIEVAFLDGVQEPFLELENGFEVDGARYKVRLDYGVDAIDFRGAYKNAGA